MIQLVPLVSSVPDQSVDTTLDGRTFKLRALWNYRMEVWHLDIADEDGDPIASGLTLVLGSYIGRRVADARMPPGLLIMSDLSGAGVEAGLDDLSVRVALYYYSVEEFAP